MMSTRIWLAIACGRCGQRHTETDRQPGVVQQQQGHETAARGSLAWEKPAQHNGQTMV
jgi:hypothetical protein